MELIKIEIFKLFGSIFVDNAEANKSIAKTDDKAGALANKLGEGIKAAAKWGAAIGAGAAVAGAAMLGMASKSAEATDRIDKMSQKLGFSREAFQEWDFILSQNGASIDSLGAGMKTLTNQVDELGKGGTVASDAFGELGMSYEDLEGLSQEEIFEKTVTALQGVEDKTKRAALANDLLGKSGQELAPLLNAGAGSVEDLKNKANELGIVLSDEAIDSGVKFTDTMDQLKRSFGAVATNIGTALIPIFQELAQWAIEHMPEIQGFFKGAFDLISESIKVTYEWFSDNLLPILTEIFTWAEKHMPEFKETMTEVWGAISTVIETLYENLDILLPVILGVTTALGAQLIINSLTKAYKAWALATQSQTTMQWLLNAAMNANPFGAVALAIGALIAVGVLLYKNWDEVSAKASELWNNLKESFGNIKIKVTDTFDSIVDSAKTWATNMVDMFVSGIHDRIDAVGDAVSAVAGKIKDFLGFSSPTKEGPAADSDKWGPNFVNMLADGITATSPKVEQAVDGLAGKLKNGVDNALSYAEGMVEKIDNLVVSVSGSGSSKTYSSYDSSSGTHRVTKDGKTTIIDDDGNMSTVDGPSDEEIRNIAKKHDVDLGVAEAMAKTNKESGIPQYADGTLFHPGGLAWVGEKGPELLNLPKGSQVTPLDKVQRSVTININGANILDDYGVDRLMDRIIERMGVLGVS